MAEPQNLFEATISTGAAVTRSGPRPDGSWGPWLEVLDLGADAVDLSRLPGAPLLVDHLARTDFQHGVVEGARVEAGKLVATLRFSSNPRSQALAAEVRDRIRRQLSVGYQVDGWRKAGGKNDALPTFVASPWTPMEVSLVAVGADRGATFRSESTTNLRFRHMSLDAQPEQAPAAETYHTRAAELLPAGPDPLAIERQRVTGILTAARSTGATSEVAERLIADGTSLDRARELLINARAASFRGQETSHAILPGGNSEPDRVVDDLATAWAHRINPAVALTDRAREFRGQRAAQGLATVLQARGIRPGGSEREIIKRAMTTSDMPLLLANAANKAMLPSYQQNRSPLLTIAHKDTVRDYKDASRHQVSAFPPLLQINEHGEYVRGSVSENRETFRVQKYGRILPVTLELLVNDELEAMRALMNSTAMATAALEADLLAEAINLNPTMADGVAVYHSTHGNLAGSAAAISIASVGAAKAAMRRQHGLDNVIIGIEPRFLVVPAALETVALQLVGEIAAAQIGDSNASLRRLEVIVDPRLDATSTTAWYLFAGPSMPSLSVAYLEGEEQPYVETRVGFDIDAVEVKVRWSLAAYWADFRPTYRNAGA